MSDAISPTRPATTPAFERAFDVISSHIYRFLDNDSRLALSTSSRRFFELHQKASAFRKYRSDLKINPTPNDNINPAIEQVFTDFNKNKTEYCIPGSDRDLRLRIDAELKIADLSKNKTKPILIETKSGKVELLKHIDSLFSKAESKGLQSHDQTKIHLRLLEINKMPPGEAKYQALKRFIPNISTQGNIHLALEITETITDELRKYYLLRVIIRRITLPAQINKAFEIIETITYEALKSTLLDAITPKITLRAQITKAFEIIETITDEWHKSILLAAIIPKITLPAQINTVLEITETCTDEWNKSILLEAIIPKITLPAQINTVLAIFQEVPVALKIGLLGTTLKMLRAQGEKVKIAWLLFNLTAQTPVNYLFGSKFGSSPK
jgi:hypothetical protein